MLATLLSFIAVAIIYVGVCLINGSLVPSILQPFYLAVPSTLIRTFIAVLTFMALGNFVLAKAFAISATISAPATMAATVIVLAVIALLTSDAKLTIEVGALVITITALSVWLSIALQRGV